MPVQGVRTMNDTWNRRPLLLDALISAVPVILADQHEDGAFGTDPWICRDQHAIFALAVAWHLPDSPHHGDPKLLQAILRGGDALGQNADEEGRWIFRKKDGSEWGMTFMPWTYSRWMRAYSLVRDGFEAADRARWDEWLIRGYTGIAAGELHSVHNIPSHHAMGLYCASQVFGREDWAEQARAFLHRVADEQSPHGWWEEHRGPVVAYNFVYMESLGTYYDMSGDKYVLEALERGIRYHLALTYPDGTLVETVDGRNPYHHTIRLGNPGFAHSPLGRRFLANQQARYTESAKSFDADYLAAMLLHGADGPMTPMDEAAPPETFVSPNAVVQRDGKWTSVLSAILAPPPDNHWGQDRQNFLSVFHRKTGLIAGGGNTRLQPLWSTFTLGDTSLMRHTPGEEDPDFNAPAGLQHMPDSAEISGDMGKRVLRLGYGKEACSVLTTPRSDSELVVTLTATCRGPLPVEAHIPLLPHLDQPVTFSSGDAKELGETPWEVSIGDRGGWIAHGGWKVSLPAESRVAWPAPPHNPYRKGGEATAEEGRIVACVPFPSGVEQQEIEIEIS